MQVRSAERGRGEEAGGGKREPTHPTKPPGHIESREPDEFFEDDKPTPDDEDEE